MLVIALRFGSYFEMIQQLLRVPRVFAGDEIGIAQNSESAQGDVLKIADRRGYDIEAGIQLGSRLRAFVLRCFQIQ